ncbi:MAG: hypothetical protein RJA22_3384 [Verrucomicrobiota bacterium]
MQTTAADPTASGPGALPGREAGAAAASALRWLARYLGPQRRRFLLISALTLAASGLAVLTPWPLKLVADHVLGRQPLPGPLANLGLSPGSGGLLLAAVLGGIGLYALTAAVEALLAFTWTRVGRRLVSTLAEDLFARLQRRSLVFHTRHPVGDTLSRVTGDSWCVWQFADQVVFAPAHALLTMSLMLFLMARLDPWLTLLAAAVAPFVVGSAFLVGKPLQRAARWKREIESRIAAHLQQTLSGIPVVQAFAQEEREQARFRQFTDDAVRAQQRTAVLGSLNGLASGLVATLGAGAILWLGARHVRDGTLSLGSLLVFLAYLTSLQAQVKAFAGVHAAWRTVSASLERVRSLLDEPLEVPDPPGATALPRVRGEVTLEHVSFTYAPDQPPVLRDISLTVPPGQTVALVGATGAGKTTLVNLIPRFLDPQTGRVLIDGHDLREVNLASLRAQVALVLQEPFLLPLSIADNIACGRPGAARAEVEAAARAANAHDFITRLPEGYNTVLGERGSTLSGGERQRIAIARALLKNAPILILDEPTSALDAATEALLLEALERLMAGRTTFLIAHRLSTVRHASRILVLQEGQIAESGTHDELLRRGGLYARLHDLQFRARPIPGTP